MPAEHGYSTAGLPLYFEWHGKPDSPRPALLLLHGGGSTIESNWGRLIPALEGSRRMLAVELRGHGHTGSPYREADLTASGDPGHAERMFRLDRELMLTGFADWHDAQVASITAPTLVVAADHDVVRVEHTVLLADFLDRPS
jgi:pimeloyl-ACP methyl ester carboxylesterase